MKRHSAIPKERHRLSRSNHHGFALLSSFPDLNSSSKKKKKQETFLTLVTSFLSDSFKIHWCHTLYIPILPLHFSVIFTWSGRSSQTQKEGDDEEVWIDCCKGSLGSWGRQSSPSINSLKTETICLCLSQDSLLYELGHMWPAHVSDLVVDCWNVWPLGLWLKSHPETIQPMFIYETEKSGEGKIEIKKERGHSLV